MIGGLDAHTFLTFYAADGLAAAAPFAVLYLARRRAIRRRHAAARSIFERRRDAALAAAGPVVR